MLEFPFCDCFLFVSFLDVRRSLLLRFSAVDIRSYVSLSPDLELFDQLRFLKNNGGGGGCSFTLQTF